MDEIKAREAFESALKTYKQEFGTFFLARLYGLEVRYEGNACIIEFDVQDHMFNPQGSLHGGIIAFAMDVSMGHLLNHESGPGATLEMKVQYVRPARSGRVRVRGEFVKRGKEISFLRSEAFDNADKLIAFATSTWKLL
jgi:uncharacterized protein (TIGR00369 family)